MESKLGGGDVLFLSDLIFSMDGHAKVFISLSVIKMIFIVR